MGPKIGIEITGDVGRPIPSAHVGSRMRSLLRRLPLGPMTAHVVFRDVNGPKGGDDIGCAVRLEVPRLPPIRVERFGRTPRIAFDASYDRVVRQFENYRERRRDARRHPKKYYVASRLPSESG